MIVILISGKAGAGKSTVTELMSKFLKANNKQVSLEAFAQPIKELAVRYFGWDGQKDEKGRKLLQDIGDAGRNYDEDCWVKSFYNFQTVKEYELGSRFVIVQDWRYPNELKFLMKSNVPVITIRVEGRAYDLGEIGKHTSENSLPSGIGPINGSNGFYDYVIMNDKSLNELESNVYDIVLDITQGV